MRNIKYTLELFIGVAGNICKKNDMKSLNGYRNIYYYRALKFYWLMASIFLVLAVVLWY